MTIDMWGNMAYHYDLIVIGAGSGGVAASRRAASYGAKVAIIEADRVGGTCVIRGCVPKKLLVYASEYAEILEESKAYGWQFQTEPHFDWPSLIASKDREIDRLNGIYLSMLEKAGVTLIKGHATIKDGHTVQVGQKVLTAERILLAPGSIPDMPSIPGIEHAISSNEVFYLPTFPKHIVIVGGGYIAVEFAGIFNGMGAKVTLLNRGDALLKNFDKELGTKLTAAMQAKGVDIRMRTIPTAIIKHDGGLAVTLTDDSTLHADQVLYAIGRKPNTDWLTAPIERSKRGAVIVDEWSQTSIPSIYAVGDVTERLALTPAAIYEARAFADTVYGNTPRPVNYTLIPTAVFSQPEVATVGLGEEEARKRYAKIDVYATDFRPMKHAMGNRNERCFMKLVVDAESDRVLGAHMIGEHAGEMIQTLAIALTCGVTKAQCDATLAIHPTLAEEWVLMRDKRQV